MAFITGSAPPALLLTRAGPTGKCIPLSSALQIVRHVSCFLKNGVWAEFVPEVRPERVSEADSSCMLLMVPLFRGRSRFESLIFSHQSRLNVTCECFKEEVVDFA